MGLANKTKKQLVACRDKSTDVLMHEVTETKVGLCPTRLHHDLKFTHTIVGLGGFSKINVQLNQEDRALTTI